MTRVVFRRVVQRDLKELRKHVSDWDAEIALEWVKSLRNKCLSLADMPGRGMPAPERGPNVRRLTHSLGKRYIYLIYYRYDEKSDTVFVLGIINGRQDLKKIVLPD